VTENGDVEQIEAGKAAWQRIRESGRRNFDDWCVVAKALDIGRAVALAEAGTDRPYGSYYVAAIGRWLRRNEFYGLDGNRGERAQMHRMLANLPEILIWRQSLNEEQRRRINHPATVVLCWQRSVRAETAERQDVAPPKTKRPDVAPRVTAEAAETRYSKYSNPRAINFDQDMIRRAATALREHWSNDVYKLAAVALSAALRNENDLLALLPPPAQVKTKKPQEPRQITAPAALELQ
jgi:hypothetical protein